MRGCTASWSEQDEAVPPCQRVRRCAKPVSQAGRILYIMLGALRSAAAHPFRLSASFCHLIYLISMKICSCVYQTWLGNQPAWHHKQT